MRGRWELWEVRAARAGNGRGGSGGRGWERWEGMGAVGAVGGDGREYLGGDLKVSEGGGSNGSNGREETPMDCTDKTDFDAF